MKHPSRLAVAALLAASASLASAQGTTTPPADTAKARTSDGYALPLKPTRNVSFTTDEGTWMSVDVSPDGRTLVFDLVGDLYTLPIGGGTATRITDGTAFDAQPRWSPDGKRILFVSDRSGSENLWTVDADGKNARAITKGDKAQYISPDWTPDGNYVVASKTNTGILGSAYDLYLIHKDGGTGVKLTGQGTAPPTAAPPGPGNPPPYSNYLGAAFGKDPRYIYSAVKRGGFAYNQTEFEWQVAVYDRETGKTFVRTNAIGAGMRPVLSPDGRWMVYATRRDSATAYRLRDLASGDETWLASNVQRDDQESRYTRDVMPGASFTPDSRALIANHHGKLWRIDVPSGAMTPIAFSAKVEQELGPKVGFEYRVNDSTLTVQQIRGARPSPDNKRLVFTALDKLWIMDLPSGKPRRLTDLGAGEFTPTWSPDGRYVAFVTWSDEGGDVYRIRTDGKAKAERLTRASAFYQNLAYSADGARLVVVRAPRQQRVQGEGTYEPEYGVELMWMPAVGGELRSISPLTAFGQPHFTKDTSRVFIYDVVDGLVSMRYDGTDRRPIVKITGFTDPLGGPQARPNPANEILVSPNGDRVIADVDNGIFLIDVPYSGGQTPTISVSAPAMAPVPVKKITRSGGDWLGWRPDGRTFYYSLGHSFFSYDIPLADSLVRDSTTRADSIAKAKEAAGARGDSAGVRRIAAADSTQRARGDTAARPDTARAGGRPAGGVALTPRDSAKVAQSDTAKKAKPAYEPARTDVLITVPKDRPKGSVALLKGARIITMKGNEVIENGDILVRDNRIAAIGPSGSLTVPAGARTIDVTGKTITPGWVDVHAHMWTSWGIHRSQVWEYMANLAYGVTTTRDPQTSTTDVLSYGDLVETGDILGPRIYSTGPGIFWTDDLKSLEDTRDFLRRYSEFYNTHTVKQYMVGDRQVRQWVAMVCKELGLTPTLEGGLDFKKNLTEAIDGYAGSEHAYPIAPLYKDVVELIAQSGITYTPTLLVLYGGPFAEDYWYESYDILNDAKLGRFTPLVELQRRGLRRPGWFRKDQYNFPQTAAQAAKIVAAGGRVGLGGHGQLQGLGVHWELWSMALGGMAPHDVLRVGTIFGAESIGLGKDLGSIEAGKLADLQVLDANPLENIRNTNTLRYVMKNGRLYEAETLKEIFPRERAVPTPWWQKTDMVTTANGGSH